MGGSMRIPVLLLTITFLSVTHAQYYDILQGLQQLFQPYPQQNDFLSQYNNFNQHQQPRQPNRQQQKKKTEERHIINSPAIQYEYVFSTTTPKSSRKTTKPNSSHNNKQNSNRNYNTDIIFSDYSSYDVTTKRNKVTTASNRRTTVKPNNRQTTEKNFSPISINFNNKTPSSNRPVLGNIYENNSQRNGYTNTNNFATHANLETSTRRPVNNGNVVYNNDYNRVPTNNRNPNVQNINLNTQQPNRMPNNDFIRPTNTRNPDVYAINNQNRGSPNRNTNFGSTSSGFINSNNNNNNNRVNNYNNAANGNFGNNNAANGNFGNNNAANSNFGSNNFANSNNAANGNFGNSNFANGNNAANGNFGNSNFANGNNNAANGNFGNNNFANGNNNANGANGNFGNNNFPSNNFGSNYNNNRGTLNTDFNADRGNIIYPNNPLLNRPGVKPAPIDPNQAPITNRPVPDRNNFVTYRPDNGFGSNSDIGGTPEILIGPDEDDMTESQKRRYAEMAERMCDRYKSLDVKEVAALPLLPSPDPVELNVSSCAPITVPLVIGGKIASINEFPHMALVGWRKIRGGGYSWKCGGSLISNQYILTAGHCTYQDKDYDVDSGPPQAVQLGSSYLDDPGALVVRVGAVVRHPKYKQRRSYYDIALIKMARTVTFSEVIKPACLGVPPRVGDNIIATGWGRTEFGGDHSVELRSVSLPVWNMGECQEIWGKSLKLPNGPTPDSHMCAGEKQGGKDTCQGDSGGPAQIQDGCVWRIVAVTSLGRSCGAPNTPALYALTKHAFIAAQVFGERSNGNTYRRQ